MVPFLASFILAPHALAPVRLQDADPAKASEGELLQNGDLGSIGPKGPLGWRLGPEATVEADGPDGTHLRTLSIPGEGQVANTGFGGLSVTEGERYHVTVWAKGPGTLGVGFGEKPIRIGRPGDHWKRMEKTIRAGGTAKNVRLVFSALGGPIQIAGASLLPEKVWKEQRARKAPGA